MDFCQSRTFQKVRNVHKLLIYDFGIFQQHNGGFRSNLTTVYAKNIEISITKNSLKFKNFNYEINTSKNFYLFRVEKF